MRVALFALIIIATVAFNVDGCIRIPCKISEFFFIKLQIYLYFSGSFYEVSVGPAGANGQMVQTLFAGAPVGTGGAVGAKWASPIL